MIQPNNDMIDASDFLCSISIDILPPLVYMWHLRSILVVGIYITIPWYLLYMVQYSTKGLPRNSIWPFITFIITSSKSKVNNINRFTGHNLSTNVIIAQVIGVASLGVSVKHTCHHTYYCHI